LLTVKTIISTVDLPHLQLLQESRTMISVWFLYLAGRVLVETITKFINYLE